MTIFGLTLDVIACETRSLGYRFGQMAKGIAIFYTISLRCCFRILYFSLSLALCTLYLHAVGWWYRLVSTTERRKNMHRNISCFHECNSFGKKIHHSFCWSFPHWSAQFTNNMRKLTLKNVGHNKFGRITQKKNEKNEHILNFSLCILWSHHRLFKPAVFQMFLLQWNGYEFSTISVWCLDESCAQCCDTAIQSEQQQQICEERWKKKKNICTLVVI